MTLSHIQDPPEPGFSCFQALASYDVSIGERRQFDEEIEIELAVEPSLFRKDLPPEAQFTAAYFDAEEHQWVEVGCQADPVGGKVAIRTRHLCLLQMWYLGLHYTIVGCGPGNDMGLAWDKTEVARETAKYTRVFPNDTPGLPDFISDLREYAISALKKYREIGLDLYTTHRFSCEGTTSLSFCQDGSLTTDERTQPAAGGEEIVRQAPGELIGTAQTYRTLTLTRARSVAASSPTLQKRWRVAGSPHCAPLRMGPIAWCAEGSPLLQPQQR